MRALLVWLPITLVLFGGSGWWVDRSLGADPDQVLVVVDSSFDMGPVWADVPDELDAIDDARYTEYALATEKDLVHSWQEELTLPRDVDPFAPCDLADVESYGEVADADRVVFLTSDAACPAEEVPDGWERVTVDG